MGALFQRLLALISFIAWLSLGAQVQVLIGSDGLLPVDELMSAVRAVPAVTPLELPTVFWRLHSDATLTAGVVIGALASLAAAVGAMPRPAFALSTALYLSFAVIGRDFLSFQWDNLLLECSFLAIFLPASRPAPLVHFLFRVVLFKLYFESGIAKWQSPIRDWQDGSAMTYYYETAPLPTALAFYAHHLPIWWHHFESRATLALELVVPFAIFGPRRARRFAAGAFTLFQILNAATANYGFFCYLAAALAVFLLDDADVARATARVSSRAPAWIRRLTGAWRARSSRALAPAAPSGTRWGALRWAGRAGAAMLVALSLLDALATFTSGGRAIETFGPLVALTSRFRLVNSYHLFSSITRERIEPELETLDAAARVARPAEPDGDADRNNTPAGWTAHDFWHKAGDLGRRPDFVAPHQPRVDFQLWFYGLAFRRRTPAYVAALVDRVCGDPASVQALFRAPLPPHASAVRLVFWQYHFASRAEARATGDWWRRTRLAATPAIPCPRVEP